MAHSLLPIVVMVLMLLAQSSPPDFLPAVGEPLATVVYLGDDPAAGPCLASLGYDCHVVRRVEDLAAVAGGAVLVTSDASVDPPAGLVGWAAFGPGEALPSQPFLALDGTVADLAIADHPVQKALRRFVATCSPLPPRGLPGVEFVASPNWDVRSPGAVIDTVVLHATVADSMAATQAIFLDTKDRQVSAHYVVDRDGTVVQMVDERLLARHAGVSELDGRTGLNDFSVGIEMVNLNDGVDPYPDAQYRAVAAILRDLRQRSDIPDSRVVSHAQVARPVGRKSDPLGFDFARLLRMAR